MYHHYVKVVSTHFKIGLTDVPTLYQYLKQSQIVYYDEDNVPEARFSYDLSLMSVVVEKEGRRYTTNTESICQSDHHVQRYYLYYGHGRYHYNTSFCSI